MDASNIDTAISEIDASMQAGDLVRTGSIPSAHTDELLAALGKQVIQADLRASGVVQDDGTPGDNSRSSRKFPWHIDGAALHQPPEYVLLVCEDPGMNIAQTWLADPVLALQHITDSEGRTTLLESTFSTIGNNGETSDRQLFARCPCGCGRAEIRLSTRGYLKPFVPSNPRLTAPYTRLAKAYCAFIDALDEAVSHKQVWQEGTWLLFQNRLLVHGRHVQPINAPRDPARRLRRIWLDAGTGIRRHAAP